VAFNDVNHALQMAVVVRTGFSISVNRHGASPELLRTHAREVHSRLAVHARCLGGVTVQLIGPDHANAVMLPGCLMRMTMLLIVAITHVAILCVTFARERCAQTQRL